MPGNPNKLFHFWQELKRRRVIHVIIVYATAAFVILEGVDIIFPRLNFPDWTITFVMILLAIGFPLALIFSWIFDVTPEGIEKTKPARKLEKEDKAATPNSWRIATYVSVVVILGLLAFNIFGGKNRVEMNEALAKSIAVLPFHNYSGDSDQDYICHGLTGEIISHLYKVESFDEVRSLTSVLNYGNPERNIPLIAQELEVNYILEGSFKRIGDDMRVTAQLIEPNSDKHIWLKDFDLPYNEIMGIPAEIALQIADHLKAFLSDDEEKRINKIPTENLDAYKILKHAIVKANTFDFESFDPLITLAKAAIEFDPEYADAYALAGMWTLYSGAYSAEKDINSEDLDEAKLYFEKAIELDNQCYTAHLGLGNYYHYREWDYVKAEEEYNKVNLLVPNRAANYLLIEEFYRRMNRLKEAVELRNQRQTRCGDVEINFLSGNIVEAYNSIECRKKNKGSSLGIGENYIWLQEFDSAKYYLETAAQSDPNMMSLPRYQVCLALAYEKTDSHKEAQKIINQQITKSDSTSAGSPAYFLGWYCSWLGKLDSAFYWLEKAYEHKSFEFHHLKVNPAFNNLKNDPRYWDLYERTGHKAYDDYRSNTGI